MRLNEYEISSVSDTASPEVQKLEDSQTKSKPSMTSILSSIPSPSIDYRFISYEDRSSVARLPLNKSVVTPLNFFSLFITPSMILMIFRYTNFKAEDTEIIGKKRAWILTTSADIEVFVKILLSMSLIRLHNTEDY